MLEPALLRGRPRYERVMQGWTDDAAGDALRHTVVLRDEDRALEPCAVATTSPAYEILDMRCRVLDGDVAAEVAGGAARLAGARMVAGFTRRASEASGPSRPARRRAGSSTWRPGPTSPTRASPTAPGGAPDSPAATSPRRCKPTSTARGRVSGGSSSAAKVARLARTPQPYAGLCSEPQAKISALLGEAVDDGLRKRSGVLIGGTSGCAPLYDLTADLLKLLAT